MFDDPWVEMDVKYPTPFLLIYRMLDQLPYDSGFTLNMAVIVLCTVVPMLFATRRLPNGPRILLVATLALLTGPAIATFDRGNSQGFLPIILFAFALANVKQRWG